jgi:hypothetical protein
LRQTAILENGAAATQSLVDATLTTQPPGAGHNGHDGEHTEHAITSAGAKKFAPALAHAFGTDHMTRSKAKLTETVQQAAQTSYIGIGKSLPFFGMKIAQSGE